MNDSNKVFRGLPCPQFAGAYNNRGNAKYNLGNYKGAIADYDSTHLS